MKDIKGFEGIYAITEDGRVWGHPRSWNTGMGVYGHNGKFIGTMRNGRGYRFVTLRDSTGKRFTRAVHRLVAQAFIPNPKNKPQVNHKNGIKNDNRLENLEWATSSENTIHGYKVLGRYHHGPRGELCGNSKLKWPQVNEIRKLHQIGLMQKVLAKQFKVSGRTISDIVNHRHWKIQQIP